ncbi:molecular chaperone for both short and long tail fibers [Aeromonas phage Asfd_1]|nr:molecular chaperone for both short and long tail fibers [Aeromonas phage Asfd_1]
MSQEQQTIAALKIRLFDAGEELSFVKSQVQDFQKTLMTIVSLTGLEPEEGAETIELEKIVEAVKALVPEVKA